MRGTIVVTWIGLVLAACGDEPRPPQVIPAMLSTNEDTPVSHEVQVIDPDGGAPTLTAHGASHGTVTVDRLRITYTPAANYHGPDAFTVTASNGTLEAVATIDVAVRPVNDAPAAAGDAFAATEDLAFVQTHAALLANDTDADGDTLRVAAVASPTHGTVAMTGTTITFTPAADYSGPASFQYTVTDGTLAAAGTVTLEVGGANDAPVAVNDTAATQEDAPLAIPGSVLVGNDADADGQTLTVIAVAGVANGTVALAGGVVTFTPLPNFFGTGAFDYTISDGTATDTGRVQVTVAAVNDAPVASADTASTPEDAALQLPASSLTANDTDLDGPISGLTVTAVGNAVNGTVVFAGGNATFTPAANHSGPASFEYTLSDGAATATGTVAIDVTAVNDAPVAADDTATTPEDTPLAVAPATLLANDADVDGPSLSVDAVGGAINGAVALAGGAVTFTPAADFSGTASFSYTLTDGTAIDTGVVTVTVTAVDDAPVAGDDTDGTLADTALVIPHAELLANDTDLDGPALSITAVQDPVNGTAALGATTVTFTPSPGFTGAASFDYVVSDGTLTDVGTVTVTVDAAAVCGDGVIASPEGCDDDNDDPGDGCSATCQLETGWTCTGAPSACTPICGDGLTVGPEPCDDGDLDDTDGCTAQCVIGAPCNATALPGADRFAVDPATGHCYASFDGEQTTFAAAQGACVASGGYLATIASAAEQAFAIAAQHPAQNPWIGAAEDADDTDAVFDWVTDEPFAFSSFAPGQPDDDAGLGGLGDCLHLFDAAGRWNDTSCDLDTFVVGRICEVEPEPCGDSVLQPAGEECDDGNAASGDGCAATCQLEAGCGDGDLDAGEECDDDNTASGDGCSAACQRELVSIAIHPAAITLARQQRVQLRAIGTFFGGVTSDLTAAASWSTTDAAIAIVGTGGVDNGRVDSLTTAGSATIRAAVGAISGSVAVNVNPVTCSIRINEVQTAGDGFHADADEFVELANPCTYTVSVVGWMLVYRAPAATSDAFPITLFGTMAPGSFRLYATTSYNGGGIVDEVTGTGGFSLYASDGGALAVRSGFTNSGPIVDSVAWGTAANAFVEGTAALAPPANRSIARSFDGNDTNHNAVDFALTDPAATPPTVPTPRAPNFP